MSITVAEPSETEVRPFLAYSFRHLSKQDCGIRIASVINGRQKTGVNVTDGMFQATKNGVRVGALYCSYRADNNILLWSPTVDDPEALPPLYDALEAYREQKQAKKMIAMRDNQQDEAESQLVALGRFEYVSDILYLAKENCRSFQPEKLRFLPLSERTDGMTGLARIVQRTYTNTADFPALLNRSSAEEMLRLYQAESPFSDDLWFFVQKDGEDIGALLLSDHSEQLELIYMGLIEEYRGENLSCEMVRFTENLARTRARPFLMTAVDKQNIAAVRAYTAQGFRIWDHKSVYLSLKNHF